MRPSYDRFYPINDIDSLKESTFKNLSQVDLRKWRNFTASLPKTPFVKDHLFEKQRGICPICKLDIIKSDGVIHHIDYNMICTYDKVVRKPDTKQKIANCEKCSKTEDCFSKVVLLHKKCHMLLHYKEGRIHRFNKGVRYHPDQQTFNF